MRPITIFSNSLVKIGELDKYKYFKWHRKYRKVNEFELHINRNLYDDTKFALGNYIAFPRTEYDGWLTRFDNSHDALSQYTNDQLNAFSHVELMRSFELDFTNLPDVEYSMGVIEYKEIKLEDSGKASETWVIRGRSLSGVFEDRLCLVGVSSGNGYDVQTNVNAETAMKHYVDGNVVNPSNPPRSVSLMEIAPDQGRGNIITTRARFQSVAQILESISLVGGLGYKTRYNIGLSKVIFEVIEGKDLTTSNGINSPVIFSPDYDNIKSLTFRDSVWGVKNVAVVAGQGEAEARTIVTVIDGAPVGIDRKEVFVDSRDVEASPTELAELAQKGNETLATTNIAAVMEFQHLQSGPFEYTKDFDLGDIVTVVYPDVAILNSRIIEVIEETTPELGNTFSLVVGNEIPDFISLIKRDRKNIENEVRK